jgi:hypothetical protein
MKISFHPKILAMSEEDFRAWFEKSSIRGKWSDYYPKSKKKTVKKVEGGGE